MQNPYQDAIHELEAKIAEARELASDPDFAEIAAAEITNLETQLKQLQDAAIQLEQGNDSGEGDSVEKVNCTFEIRPGAGGDEAKIWANDLKRMYVRFLEMHNFKIEHIDDLIFKAKGKKVDYLVGTMIELPRAALTADEIAGVAEFFSFGTNDLTQTTFGLSRDDAGKFLPLYVERDILPRDPFESIDQNGVGQLVEIGTQKGRKVNPKLKVGICGEHGGDPKSVRFCHETGLTYVSCSPFRVPIARLAAAQAVLLEEMQT